MWSDIRDIINDTYKGDFDEQSYKYEFFKNITDFFADRTAVDFLEIGSYQGVSLVIVAHILRSAGKLGRIVSIDPYFPEGYLETPPLRGTHRMDSTPATMSAALELYRRFDLSVELIQQTSEVGARALLNSGREFDMIFVDGNHERLHPLVDTSLSILLLKERGLLCLDDVRWPDVAPVAELCSRHMTPVFYGRSQIALTFATDVQRSHPPQRSMSFYRTLHYIRKGSMRRLKRWACRLK